MCGLWEEGSRNGPQGGNKSPENRGKKYDGYIDQGLVVCHIDIGDIDQTETSSESIDAAPFMHLNMYIHI